VITRPRSGPLHISLSHSEPYTAAAVDLAPVGIDIEVVRHLSEAATHLFLTDEETEQLQSCSIADRLIHFWAAKEAAWKRLEGTIETLKRVPVRLEDYGADWVRFDGVETVRIGDAVIALTRPIS
jgi:phosphopantetheinyl transferase